MVRIIHSTSLHQQLNQCASLNAANTFSPYFTSFLNLSHSEQQYELHGFAWDRDIHGHFVNQALRTIYRYLYGYPDYPCRLRMDDHLVTQLLRAKAVVEHDMITRWLPSRSVPAFSEQTAAAQYLNTLAESNPAIEHPLYTWLAEAAPRQAVMRFVDHEVLHNEVDKVAILACGHQWLIKAITGINMADEVTRGKVAHANTLWLRLYADQTDGWARIRQYRYEDQPWFANIVSNVFNVTLTRPGLACAAYGHFLMAEALAGAHCEKVLKGLRRCGLCEDSSMLRYAAHARADTYDAEGIRAVLTSQRLALAPDEINQIVVGANWAIAGALEQYGRLMIHYSHDESG